MRPGAVRRHDVAHDGRRAAVPHRRSRDSRAAAPTGSVHAAAAPRCGRPFPPRPLCGRSARIERRTPAHSPSSLPNRDLRALAQPLRRTLHRRISAALDSRHHEHRRQPAAPIRARIALAERPLERLPRSPASMPSARRIACSRLRRCRGGSWPQMSQNPGSMPHSAAARSSSCSKVFGWHDEGIYSILQDRAAAVRK